MMLLWAAGLVASGGLGGAEKRMTAHDLPEERRVRYLARAEAARVKAEEATDKDIREWWASAAKAWQDLADGLRAA